MTMNRSIQLYISQDEDCPYLDGRVSRNLFADPYRHFGEVEYAQLLRMGFRRSGNMCYRPGCPDCRACIPIRIPVAAFQPNRNQRRCLRRHGELTTHSLLPHWNDEHYQLYRHYQAHRHTGGIMDSAKAEIYQSLIDGAQFNARMIEFRDADGELKMLSIVDFTRLGLSAVYTFFQPEDNASYGRYSILWQIQQAQQLGLPHVYLGYWIRESPKMAYKTEYRPFEILNWDEGWQQPEEDAPPRTAQNQRR